MNTSHVNPATWSPICLITSQIWTAISLVGAKTRAWGARSATLRASRATTANTIVFPVPDLAWVITSRPHRPRGITWVWIGDGVE